MKKFFSLVLALVMALSLTTVAWGAYSGTGAGTEADPYQVTSEAELKEAVLLGGYIKLMNDIDLFNYLYLDAAGTVIIDGGNNTISTSSGAGNSLFIFKGTDADNYTIKNIKFDAPNTSGTAVVWVAGPTVSIIDCDFADSTGPLCVVGADAGKVTLSGCSFTGADPSYSVVYFNTAVATSNFVVENCVFTGNTAETAVVYFRGPASFEATGNTFTNNVVTSSQNGAVLYADEVTATGNTFTDNEVATAGRAGVVVADMGEVTGNVFSGNDVDGVDEKTATVVAKGDPNTELVVDDNYWDGTAPDVANDGDGDVDPSTYYTTATGGVLGGAMTVGGAYSYDMVTTDIAATKTVGVTVATFKAKAPKDADKSGFIDDVDELGNVKYVVFSNMNDKYFVQVSSVKDADYTVYQTGTKTVFGYFDEVDSPFYAGDGVAFYDFGDKCGQYDDEPETGVKYYTWQGILFKTSLTPDINLMVGGKLTPVEAMDDTNWVAHVPAFTYDKDYKVVGVKCAECGTAAVIYANYASVPKADKLAGNAYLINDNDYYCWQDGPVADTDVKVESAETFDAGIAMYVGMSVLAATGSAVVIGKKKD